MTGEDAPTADDTSVGIPAAEVSELGSPDESMTKALAAYRQGDLLEGLDSVHVVGPDGDDVAVPAPLGLVLRLQMGHVADFRAPVVLHPVLEKRFDPSEPYIPRLQWRNAYRSYRANQAHPEHNIGV